MPDEAVLTSGVAPVGRAQLASDLRALGVQPGIVLMVHARVSALGWVVGGTALAAAAAFSIIYDSIRGGDGFYPVPVAVPQPVAVPVAVPVRSPLPPYCPPYTPLACRAPAAWPPAPWYTAP